MVPAGLLHTKGVRGVEPHSERTTKPPDIVGPHPHRVGGVQPFGFRKESLVADTAAPGVTSEPAEGGGLPKPAAAGLLARRPSPKGPRVSIIGDELRTQKSIHLSPLPSTQRSPVASEKATPSESVRTVTKPSQPPLSVRHSTTPLPGQGQVYIAPEDDHDPWLRHHEDPQQQNRAAQAPIQQVAADGDRNISRRLVSIRKDWNLDNWGAFGQQLTLNACDHSLPHKMPKTAKLNLGGGELFTLGLTLAGPLINARQVLSQCSVISPDAMKALDVTALGLRTVTELWHADDKNVSTAGDDTTEAVALHELGDMLVKCCRMNLQAGGGMCMCVRTMMLSRSSCVRCSQLLHTCVVVGGGDGEGAPLFTQRLRKLLLVARVFDQARTAYVDTNTSSSPTIFQALASTDGSVSPRDSLSNAIVIATQKAAAVEIEATAAEEEGRAGSDASVSHVRMHLSSHAVRTCITEHFAM